MTGVSRAKSQGRVVSGMDALLDVGGDVIRPDVRLLLETHDGAKFICTTLVSFTKPMCLPGYGAVK